MSLQTEHAPLNLPALQPMPIVGLTRGLVAEAEAQRELTAILYRYYRAVDRLRTGRTAHHAHL